MISLATLIRVTPLTILAVTQELKLAIHAIVMFPVIAYYHNPSNEHCYNINIDNLMAAATLNHSFSKTYIVVVKSTKHATTGLSCVGYS